MPKHKKQQPQGNKPKPIVKIVKAVEIKPGKKYFIILPKHAAEDPKLGPALFELFRENPMVALLVNDPEKEVKVLEVTPDKPNGKVIS